MPNLALDTLVMLEIYYSGLVSEVPEKAATIAGARTIPTKERPIRRSCICVSPDRWLVRARQHPYDDSSHL